jgi:23S rRNA pseudouridine1911/1915/1917 synthase
MVVKPISGKREDSLAMGKPPGRSLEWVVSKPEEGLRLDIFLSKVCPHLSRSQIKRWIVQGKSRINGQSGKASRHLQKGERVRLEIPVPELLELAPQDIPLHILFEDSDILVLNKAAEMVVHPGAGVQHDTVVNAILHHCKDLSGIGGKLRPGIVHRLDKGTSGVLLVAKNDFSHHALAEQFQARSVEKIYHAFVWGMPRPSRGEISLPLGRHLRDRKKISAFAGRTREAVTEYKLLDSWGPISWLELKPKTGRTHQIRVHLAERGHPVVGDPTYGKGRRNLASLPPPLQARVQAFPFQLLHASQLSFVHPRSGVLMKVEAPLRGEMQEFLKILRKWKSKS